MENKIPNGNEVLCNYVNGFHQYVLDNPVHLNYASCNLCEMLGVSQESLLDADTDKYFEHVYEHDRAAYSEFIRRLASKEQTLTLSYRIVSGDGKIIYVSDTMTSKRQDDKTLAGYSVLTDITSLREEIERLNIFNDTVQYGFIKCTCEKQPRIKYMNEYMLEMMRFPETEAGEWEFDYLGMYRENIYLMIPPEERRRFALYLNRVYTNGLPFTGEMALVRCDGSIARVFGWLAMSVDEHGGNEFQAAFIDISKRYEDKKNTGTVRDLYANGKAGSGRKNVYIRTFGYFDVFVDGKPIAFRSQKSKELLALLVDRKGGFVSSEEAVGFLWENEPYSAVVMSRYRKIAHRLKNILEEYGIADIVEVSDGKRRIVNDRVCCDLYDYLSGKEEFGHLFKGSYLTNYSWGEITLGELTCGDRFSGGI